MRSCLAVLVLCVACAARADWPPIIEGGDRILVAQWDSFDVEIADRLPDACLPRPQRLKAVVAEHLEEHGFRLNSQMVPAVVRVNLTGYEASGGCVALVDTKVMTFERILVPNSRSIAALNGGVGTTVTKRHLAIGSSLISAESEVIQDRLEQAVRRHVSDLHWLVQRARDYAFAEWPEIEEAWLLNRTRPPAVR